MKSFRSPGPTYSVSLLPPVEDPTVVNTPPVWLRTSCSGAYMANAGQEVAGLGALAEVLFAADAPLAMAAEMDGLPVVMKLPHMAAWHVSQAIREVSLLHKFPQNSLWKASSKSGPWLAVAGPRVAVASDPCVAIPTEY